MYGKYAIRVPAFPPKCPTTMCFVSFVGPMRVGHTPLDEWM